MKKITLLFCALAVMSVASANAMPADIPGPIPAPWDLTLTSASIKADIPGPIPAPWDVADIPGPIPAPWDVADIPGPIPAPWDNNVVQTS